MADRAHDPEVLALIPARGGSKNPPDKNIRPFCGRPLIVHSIEQALHAQTVHRVVVSTDSERIARISRDAGAEVPFLRPAEFAQDYSTDLEVFRHALTWLREHEAYRPDIIVHVRPTSPLRTPEQIDRGVGLLRANPTADAVRSVSVPSQTPFKMWRVVDGWLQPLLDFAGPEACNAPRQKLPAVYWQNGYVDVTRYTTVMEHDSMTGRRILPLIIDDPAPLDIDSFWDLEIGEALMRARSRANV